MRLFQKRKYESVRIIHVFFWVKLDSQLKKKQNKKNKNILESMTSLILARKAQLH